MSSLRPLIRGIRALLCPSAVEHDVDDEVRHYFDEAVASHMARGLSRDAALRAARSEMGQSLAVREQIMDVGWEARFTSLSRDVRQAARGLRRDAIFTTVAVLTLALGIGASTAIVAAVTPVLFEPLPYPGADRLVSVIESAPSNASRNPGTYAMFAHLAARTRSFDAMAVLRSWQPTLTGVEPPERLEGQRVSAAYFRVLGVAPAAGRGLQADDDRPGSPRVVVLSDALWQRRYGADPSIVGRTVQLDDVDYTVVGIMPARFENVLAPSADLWAPLQYDLSGDRAWGHHLQTIGRLRPGVDAGAASSDVQAVGHAVLEELKPESYDRQTRFSAAPLKDDLVRGVRPAFAVVLGAVLLLLAIACVNVANLQLARNTGRRGELALRSALGASRARLAQQLVTETLMLAALGGTGGILFARLAVDVLVATAPSNLFRLQAVAVGGPVFWCGIGLTSAIGLGLGLLGAGHAGRGELRADLGAGSLRSTGARRPVRRALVVVQVALAVVLLVGSGLLLRSLARLFAIDPGFDPSRVLTVQVQLTGSGFSTPDEASRFFDRALEAIRDIPGVRVAGATSQLPLSGDRDEYGAHFEADGDQPAASHSSFRYAVSPGYLEAMGIPLREGRFFDSRDRADSPRVAVISEALARRRFADAPPVGARLRIGPADSAPYTIVGVVGSVRQVTLAADETDAVYTPAVQWDFLEPIRSLVVRADGDPHTLAAPVRQAIWSVDRSQPIVRVASMTDLVLATASERRFVLRLLQGFTLAALLLAAAGLYGLLAGSVAERVREIGVRSALGASRRAVLSLIVGEGMGLTLAGLAAGLAMAALGTQFISGLLFDVSRFDPWTYLGAIGVLVTAAAVASVLPAWRAARIDPVVALRVE